MRPLPVLLAAALSIGGAGAAQAQAQSQSAPPAVAVGVTGGTTGVGVEAQIALGPVFTLRGAVDRLTYDFEESYDGVDYQAEMAFDTIGGFVDLHPFGNAFLISGGAYVGDRDVDLDATPTGPVEIGGQTYSPSQVGTLNGRVKLAGVSPFLGLGWDDTFYRRSRWGFRAVAGVALSEDPDVALTSEGGSLSNDPAFQQRLNDEARRIAEETDGYGAFPVIQVGLSYKF